MDELKLRMLELPKRFYEITEMMIDAHRRLAELRLLKECTASCILTETARNFPEKSNKEVRDAMTASALLTDGPYNEIQKGCLKQEEALKAGQMHMDALKFEANLLIAIAGASVA